jgi:predicted RNase H-like HicB family nuclease
LQLLLVLLEDAVVVVLPELLGGVLSGDTLEDYCQSAQICWKLYEEHTLLASRMLLLEVCEIVYIFVNDDVKIVRRLVRRNVSGREAF